MLAPQKVHGRTHGATPDERDTRSIAGRHLDGRLQTVPQEG